VIGVTHLNNNLNCSSNDQYLTARRATEKVLELGYKRPMLVVPREDDALLEDKFSSGFHSVSRRLPAEDQLALVPFDLDEPQSALLAIRQQNPDVVITNKSEIYASLQDDGVSIPKELGLVHLDWHDALPNMAGMRQNNRIVGSAGVDLTRVSHCLMEKGIFSVKTGRFLA
jgi:DNA-binding LacI/PurR family transcriptional regulator